jgi:hypothetical protein
MMEHRSEGVVEQVWKERVGRCAVVTDCALSQCGCGLHLRCCSSSVLIRIGNHLGLSGEQQGKGSKHYEGNLVATDALQYLLSEQFCQEGCTGTAVGASTGTGNVYDRVVLQVLQHVFDKEELYCHR